MANDHSDDIQEQYEKAMLISALKDQVVSRLSGLITREEAVMRAKQLAEEWIDERQTDSNFEFHFDAIPSTFVPSDPQHINCLNDLKQLIED